MLIVVGSKYLSQTLNKIDFKSDRVMFIEAKKEAIVFHTMVNQIEIDCYLDASEGEKYDQSDRRWDWVRQTLNEISDQPVTFQIHSNRLNVVLNY